ncbi:MAG: leucine-rich repeat protein [Bacteroidales bacterium]|nr:leucine-rich repeat protein [Candidatus Sodaliphilus aphodohippi]
MKKVLLFLAMALMVCSTAMARGLFLESAVGTIDTLAGREAMVVDLGGSIGKVAIATMNVGAKKTVTAGITMYSHGTEFNLGDANDPNKNGLTDGWYVPSKAEFEALQSHLSYNKNFSTAEWKVTETATLCLTSKYKNSYHQGIYALSDREQWGDHWNCWTYRFSYMNNAFSDSFDKSNEADIDECVIRPFHKLDSVENCRIYYTSSYGNVVEPGSNSFNASIVSNTYENGQGIITFGGELTSIGPGAFYRCSTLTSVTIPATVKSIGYDAFCGCSSLETLKFADGSKLETIDVFAFSGTNITAVTIPATVTNIGYGAFNQTQIATITIPASVKEIGEQAFSDCSQLSSLAFADGSQLEAIGMCAFFGTAISGDLTIPATVTSMGSNIFGGCQLSNVYMSSPDLSGISNLSFNGSGIAMIVVPAKLYEAYQSHFSDIKVVPSDLKEWKEYALGRIEVGMQTTLTFSDTDKATIAGYISTIKNATTFDETLDAYKAAMALIDKQKGFEAKTRDALDDLGTGHVGPAIRVTGKNGKSIMLFNLDKVEFVNVDVVNVFGQGEAEATGIGEVKWIQLWEGGPGFAEYNIGATSATEYGDYYTWGGFENVVGINNPSYNGGTSALSSDTDTAIKLWGSNWRMPTKDEFAALISKCDVELTTIDGIKGWRFTGKGNYKFNSIFLPIAGSCYNANVSYQGITGNYWSSTSDGEYIYSASCLDLNPSNAYTTTTSRNIGCSVRAVLNETK